jgi:hypothetical protein
LQKYVGVVVLGGALEPGYVWQAHGQVALTDAAERMIVPLACCNVTLTCVFYSQAERVN